MKAAAASKHVAGAKSNVVIEIKIDPLECPFREFKDNELSPDYWGLNLAAFKALTLVPKQSIKASGATSTAGATSTWRDDQTQPLPASVRHYLDGWVRAEDLAWERWESEVLIADEGPSKMTVIDYQLSHAQALLRSTFCRKVLSACYILERNDTLQVEHQWEGFNCAFGPEGWRARYHIYSPGLKSGGGPQHKPTLSKNGCYLVRLYHLGAWRCVWVSDQVPVDAMGAPLLPFSPLTSPSPVKGKGIPATVTSPFVYLWPLLICKALLKIGAPDMNADEEEIDEDDCVEVQDEEMSELDIMYALTGCISLMHDKLDYEGLWALLQREVKMFSWDEDEDFNSSALRSKNPKKPVNKDKDKPIRGGMTTVLIADTKDFPPYALPGITPGMEMSLIVDMIRDVPLKKPLPEPEVPLWKTYRWIDWARAHGLYDAYECPRTKFLKVNGLMKLSYAPHLLEVQSTESINTNFRERHNSEKVHTQIEVQSVLPVIKPVEKVTKSKKTLEAPKPSQLNVDKEKEALREWMPFAMIHPLTIICNTVHYPSQFSFTSASNHPSVRITKVPLKGIDIHAPHAAPLYLQIDSSSENCLKISLCMLHPRIIMNNGYTIEEYIEKAYVIIECFEWFTDNRLPMPHAFVMTRGYDAVEVEFAPGRHYCRVWVHSRMNWHLALVSESALLLGSRDVIQVAATQECPWVSKFLNNLGAAFANWIRVSRSATYFEAVDREFYTSYQPDLTWDPEVVGYDHTFVHWMFRQALQSHLSKRLAPPEYHIVCMLLRRQFLDPDFGFPPKPKHIKPLRDIISKDPCDCTMPEAEYVEEEGSIQESQQNKNIEPKAQNEAQSSILSSRTMNQLLAEPTDNVQSQLCELATAALPCYVLRDEREKVVRRHEAATLIQSHWRGYWARKCMGSHITVTTETFKVLMDNAFGNQEMQSQLMNEFFHLFPGAKYAYSVASGLAGAYGLQQHNGVSPVTGKCKWIPYFQGVFYCHHPVKIHFDVFSTIEHSTVQIYDNDTGEQLPQAYNAHITFDIHPNVYGYTVLGHGSYNQPLGFSSDIHWQLTVMASTDNVFHVCDNESDVCTTLPLTTAYKLHIDEIYIPNRRNILGAISISVTRVEAVSFRAAVTTPDLEIEAILRTTDMDGEPEVVATCHGKGEINWPYIRLKPNPMVTSHEALNKPYQSASNLRSSAVSMSMRNLKTIKKPVKSATKILGLKTPVPLEPKTYTIEVRAPQRWPLPLANWKRIDVIRNDVEIPKIEAPKGKVVKEKTGSAKEKKRDTPETPVPEKVPVFTVHQPLPDDAYTELECSTTVGGGAYARRDDDRDILYANALRSWDMKEPGRNARGAEIRQQFRDEFLVPPTTVKSESFSSHLMEELEGESKPDENVGPGPTPASNSALSVEMKSEEEALYTTMPESLKDKFVPLYFVPLCTKELEDEQVVLTEAMAEAAKNERKMRIDAALERMRDLQEYNEIHVLGRQKHRLELLQNLLIEAAWTPELVSAMEARDQSIQQEIQERQASATKKKMEAKNVTTKGTGKK